jgi:hypothetical protein
MRIAKITSNLPILILLIFSLLSIISFLTSHERELINNFEDDSYYYFTIARNFVDVKSLTFDGLTTTNGFHPLWMFVLIPFFLIFDDQVFVLRAIGVFSIIIVSLAAYNSLIYIKSRYSLLPYYLSTAIILACVISFGSTGMETTILVPLIISFVIYLDGSKLLNNSPPKTILLLGVLMVFIEFSRLDAVIFNIIVLAFLFLLSKSASKWKTIIFLGLPSFVFGLVYLVANYKMFGHLNTTSGSVKTMGYGFINEKFIDQLMNLRNPQTIWIGYSFVLCLTIVTLLLLFFLKISSKSFHWQDNYLIPLILSVYFVVYSGIQIFSTSWYVWIWYAYPFLLMGIFVVPFALDLLLSHLKSFEKFNKRIHYFEKFAIVGVFILMSFIGIRWGYWRKPVSIIHHNYENYGIAQFLNKQFQEPVIAAMGDRAGSFGYFFEGKVLQLEGLVGDYQILKAIQNNDLMDYMSGLGVDYVVSNVSISSNNAPPLAYSKWTLVIPLPELSSGPYAKIQVCKDTEFLRRYSQFAEIVIWKWPSCIPAFARGTD